jgi:phosphomannomutase
MPPRALASPTSTGSPSDFDTWHFNVRPSNTEPLLRLNLEALSEDEMETRRDELVALIQS